VQRRNIWISEFSLYYSGAAPFMLSERGLKKLLNRKTKVASYNFDLNLIGDYWGWFDKRSYHATGMISMW
jgi:alanine-glyoxylate transaminase/serine-glyoxylate transaminase/serine-pyruvate transaminase